MYFGIICGYILRIIPHTPKREKSSKGGIVSRVISFGIYLKNLFFSLLCFVKTIFSSIKSTIQRFFINLKISIVSGIRKRCDILKEKILANTVIYIWLKVAQIYSVAGRKVILLHYSGVKDYCNSHKTKYFVIEDEQNRPVCKPKYFELQEETIEYYKSPEIYVAQIKDARISGGSSIIIADDKCIYDPFIADTEKRLDIKFSNTIGNINNELMIAIAPASQNISEGIFMVGFASYNYYHMTVEIMSRLRYVDSIEEYRNFPIIVDEIVLKIPQYKELLDKINVHKHRIITIGQSENAVVENLIVPSYNTWMPINVKRREMIRTSDFLIAKSALENIRSCLPEPKGEADKYIFISRKNLTATRLGNEAEIVKLFKKSGFDIVYTENLSYLEQVKLFQKAKCVVATSGAALTNILYCRKNTDVVCIIPEEYKFYMYSTIAYLLELNPIFLNAEVTLKTVYTASDIFELNVEYCKRFLKKYMNKKRLEIS